MKLNKAIELAAADINETVHPDDWTDEIAERAADIACDIVGDWTAYEEIERKIWEKM